MNAAGHAMPEQVLLKLKGICKLYPGTIALNDVNVDIEAGECHGIIGKNGAGKTTLVKIISGVIPQSKGQIFIHGKPCHSLTRRQAKKIGISIVTQEPQIIPEFTVAENLLFPDYPCFGGKKIIWKKIHQIAKRTLEQAGMQMSLDRIGSDLSVSEQQLLLVVKAFFVDRNDIIILDEVTTALSRKDQEYLFDLIENQKLMGKAIVFISHRMSEIIRICDSITVLRDSRVIVSRKKEAMDESDLSRLIVGDTYVEQNGAEDKEAQNRAPVLKTPKKCLLQVEELTLAGKFHNLSFTLNQGEVVGLAGLRGSGRTELMKTIVGVYSHDYGNVRLEEKSVQFKHPRDAFLAGVAYLPEDRDREGLVEILSVKNNISLSSLFQFTRRFIIKTAKENKAARNMVDELDIKVSTYEQEVKTLSGGNRQKVVIARLMTAAPKVFLLDEPTKGIDIGAKNAILQTIQHKLTKTGGIIMTSPSVEDLMLICNTILVLHNGRILRKFSRDEFDLNQIYLAIQGVASIPEDEQSDQLDV